jgi:surface protein
MFNGATAFNGNITSWNTASVTNMTGVFTSASAFNQNIGGWNTSNVTDMQSMFYSAISFNQDITNWDTSKVTSMFTTFRTAAAFNQNIAKWNYASMTNFSQFLHGITLSTEHYDALLISLASQNLGSTLTFSGGSSKYSAGTATTKRSYLASTKGWTISDGGADTAFPTSGAFTTTSGVGQTAATLNWTAASDTVTPQANLEYYVCSGASLVAIDTTFECLAATQVMNWTANITTFNLTGLTANTTYYFNVLVRDGSLNRVAYDTVAVTTSP